MSSNRSRVLKNLLLLVASLSTSACVSVKAPERIVVNHGPPAVDSSRIPNTSTHEEARHELVKAYENIQYLEQENQRLSRKAAEYKSERDECRAHRDSDGH